MKLEFPNAALRDTAFSQNPMTFFDSAPREALTSIVDLVTIETGDRKARERWQKTQLKNLLRHAHERSAFWRKRIDTKHINSAKLSDLPVQTRADVVEQVRTEGALLRGPDGIPVQPHSTSGSSGTPVQFFISAMNGRYNAIRSMAQYFLEGRDLTKNRVRLRGFSYSEFKSPADIPANGFTCESSESWMGELSGVFRTGTSKFIKFWHPNHAALLKELSKDPIGFLVIQPRLLEELFATRDIGFLKKHGTEMLVPMTAELDTSLRQSIERLGIPVRGNYSTEEVGPVGYECQQHSGIYHLAGSNVIVEVAKGGIPVEGKGRVSQVLITHLHSYATPFIRYDVGDLASYHDTCPCGYDGPAISAIVGRKKQLLKHPSGAISSFFIRARDFTTIANIREYRVRQTTIDRLAVEVAAPERLTDGQLAAVLDLVRNHAGTDFQVEVVQVDSIDWGANTKRLGFVNEIL